MTVQYNTISTEIRLHKNRKAWFCGQNTVNFYRTEKLLNCKFYRRDIGSNGLIMYAKQVFFKVLRQNTRNLNFNLI